MNTILYFGCIGDTGHYLWRSEHQQVRYPETAVIGDLWPKIDNGFVPPHGVQGNYLRTESPPWIILAWADNSVDSRPGSNSAFLFRDFDGVIDACLFAAAHKLFPSVFKRQLVPLRRAQIRAQIVNPKS